jgi:hypothetical protein
MEKAREEKTNLGNSSSRVELLHNNIPGEQKTKGLPLHRRLMQREVRGRWVRRGQPMNLYAYMHQICLWDSFVLAAGCLSVVCLPGFFNFSSIFSPVLRISASHSTKISALNMRNLAIINN